MNGLRHRSGLRITVFITGALLTLAGAFFTTAEADGVSGTLSGMRVVGTNVTISGGDVWAGQFRLSIDGGGFINTYCIDFHTDTADGEHYDEGTWSEANVANLGKVRWVLHHGYPTTSAAALATASGALALTDDQAAAATQTAIWFLTDGIALDASNDASVLAAYQYLISSATSDPEPSATLSVTPASLQGTVGQKIGPFTVATTAASVTLSSPSGTITDAVGNPLATVGNGGTFYVTMSAPGTVVVDAQATATLPYGRVFLASNPPKQKLITAATTSTKASASVSVTGDPTTTTTAVTTTTAAATTTTAAATTTTTAKATTTTQLGSGGPTTTQLGSDAPTTTVSRVLPRTGGGNGSLPLVALGLLLIGLSLVLSTRRQVA